MLPSCWLRMTDLYHARAPLPVDKAGPLKASCRPRAIYQEILAEIGDVCLPRAPRWALDIDEHNTRPRFMRSLLA